MELLDLNFSSIYNLSLPPVTPKFFISVNFSTSSASAFTSFCANICSPNDWAALFWASSDANGASVVSSAPLIKDSIPKVGEESDLADDVKFLKEGFDEVKANNYPFGFATYARDKYIKSILETQGIDNYPTTYDAYMTPQKTTDAPQVDQNQVQTKAKANDGTKFDVSQIGPKENIGINIQSKRAKEGGGFGSASSLLDGLRNTISKINQSSVDDDEKEKLANDARQFVREELKKLGLNPDDFTL